MKVLSFLEVKWGELMSKLLLDEQPLVLLPQLAITVGLNEAIVLQQINYWINLKEKVKAKDSYKDEYYWVYNTYEQWKEQFPFWSTKTIQRTVQKLEDMGILISTSMHNQKGYDRTKWYRIDHQRLDELENEKKKSIKNKDGESAGNTHKDNLSSGEYIENTHKDKLSPASGQSVQMEQDNLSSPIPEITTETTTDILNLSIIHNEEDNEKNDGGKNEDDLDLQRILKKCELDHLKRYSAYGNLITPVKQAITDMYFAKEMKVHDAVIPRSIIRRSLVRLDPFIIEYALEKFSFAAKGERIKSPRNYLKSCIYNAITDCSLGTYAEAAYNLANTLYDHEPETGDEHSGKEDMEKSIWSYKNPRVFHGKT
jgi:hypothetical protein